MIFTRDTRKPKEWDVQFVDPSAYAATEHSIQVQRLVAAGARLAEVLNSVWPSKKAAAACHGVIH
jgi:hypothetical protein